MKEFFDSSIMINCDKKTLEQRLIKRWKSFNYNNEEINQKVYDNDLPNALDVMKNSSKSDFVLDS